MLQPTNLDVGDSRHCTAPGDGSSSRRPTGGDELEKITPNSAKTADAPRTGEPYLPTAKRGKNVDAPLTERQPKKCRK
jgi:hypothetical protein